MFFGLTSAFLDGALNALIWCAVGLFAGWAMFRAPLGRRCFTSRIHSSAPVETIWSSFLLEPSPPGGWGGAVEISGQCFEGDPPTRHRAVIRHGGVGPFRESVWRLRSLAPHALFHAEQESLDGAVLSPREAAVLSLRLLPAPGGVLIEHELSRPVRGVFGFLYIPRANRRALDHLRRHCEEGGANAAAPIVGFGASAILAVIAFALMVGLFSLGDSQISLVAVFVAFSLQLALWTHEYGHLIAMRWFGHKDAALVMVPFLGGATIGGRGAKSAFEEAMIALMGPAFSGAVVLALTPLAPLGLKFFETPGASVDWPVWLGLGVVAFLAMAVPINLYNLAPIAPLDGGRILAVLARKRVTRAVLGAVIFGVLAFGIAGTGRQTDLGAAVVFVAVAWASTLLSGDKSTVDRRPMSGQERAVVSLLLLVTLAVYVDASRVLLPSFLDAMRNDMMGVSVATGGGA